MVKINDVVVGNECYPNNERILKSIDYIAEEDTIIVDFSYRTDMDISILMFYKKYLDDIYPNNEKILIMRYIPYSRMDRKIDGYIFSLQYFSEVINDMNFDCVHVLDPHSGVSTDLIKNCIEINISENINTVIKAESIDYIMYPDKGAMSRYSEMLENPVPYFYGSKKRDLTNGRIISFELIDVPNLTGKNVLIIDDLCSYGGTSLKAGKAIKEHGATNVSLYVSHCEQSIYKGDILKTDYINKVYTTDSLLEDFSSKKIVKL